MVDPGAATAMKNYGGDLGVSNAGPLTDELKRDHGSARSGVT
jgi:hypothetical protein